MAQPKVVELLFPAGGLQKNVGYQHIPPYATPLARNVRPFDSLETRQRGGSRQGLVKAVSPSNYIGNPGLPASMRRLRRSTTFWSESAAGRCTTRKRAISSLAVPA